MSLIVAVHGIAQQLAGSETLAKDWRPALRDGLINTGIRRDRLPQDTDIHVAFYGDLFRRATAKSAGDIPWQLEDIKPGIEEDLLAAWWDAAIQQGDARERGAQVKVWAPGWVQRAFGELSRINFFSRLSEWAMVGNLKQVSLYFGDPKIREIAKQRLLRNIREDTKVVIGHSLGSVVAYEALCELAPRRVQMFISLGSPLGLRPIFSKLNPPPDHGRGKWPNGVASWTNIAATRDPVAAIKQLAPLFDDGILDRLIDNETRAHDVEPYLTARATGEAIANGLGASL